MKNALVLYAQADEGIARRFVDVLRKWDRRVETLPYPDLGDPERLEVELRERLQRLDEVFVLCSPRLDDAIRDVPRLRRIIDYVSAIAQDPARYGVAFIAVLVADCVLGDHPHLVRSRLVDVREWIARGDVSSLANLERRLRPFPPATYRPHDVQPSARARDSAPPAPALDSAPPRQPQPVPARDSGGWRNILGRLFGFRRPASEHGGTVSRAHRRGDAVLFAISVPHGCRAGSSFVACFCAYIEEARAMMRARLSELGERKNKVVVDLAPQRRVPWTVGAPVQVRLTGAHIGVTPQVQCFEWNGQCNVVNFSVTVEPGAAKAGVNLMFEISLDGVPISFVTVHVKTAADARATQISDYSAPGSAFASYASEDAEVVGHKLSTLARWAPSLDIFQDCLDLTPNKSFKRRLAEEIERRDVFLLFWSRNAANSQWVRWEYGTARDKKGMDAILPMPLEDPQIAPPPKEFSQAHMRDRFMLGMRLAVAS